MIKCLDNKIRLIFVLIGLLGMTLTACGSKEEDYRQIQVYKIDGTATVARAGSSMDAYENMQLQSGDVVETVANSYVQLKLDEDKYILLEPDTKISLQATGNSADSNTAIFLEKGAIVNQLDNPLSEKSNYQVTTPNSTMAVRGTTFRVEITYDENGESFAKVAVYGGKVECMLVFPDGSVQEPVMIEGGMEVLVRGDDVESEYVMTGTTSYEELREKVLEFLEVAIERGEELSISQEEIEVLIEVQQALEEGEAEIEEVPEEELAEETTEEDFVEEETEEQSEENQLQETPQEELEETEEEEKGEPKDEEKKEPQQPSVVTPSNPPTSGDNGGAESGGTGGGGNNGSTDEGATEEGPQITVKFVANGKPFAEKGITGKLTEDGMSVIVVIDKIPILKPGTTGGWWYEGKSVAAGTSITVGTDAEEITISWQ